MPLKIKNAFLILVLWLAIYTLLRLVFYFVYFDGAEISTLQLLKMLYWGVRFDFTALFYINLPFFFFYFFLFHWFGLNLGRTGSVSLLMLNVIFLAINFIDLIYYRYNLRRSNYDFLYVFWDSRDSFFSLIKTWWYLVVLFLVVSISVSMVQWKLLSTKGTRTQHWKHHLIYFFFLLSGFFIARGNGARPIIPSTALLHFPSPFMPFVTNSTITFLYSMWKEHETIKPLAFYTDDQLDSLFTIQRLDNDTLVMSKKNVIIFILESFTREYLDPDHKLKAHTPFLDSMRKKSINCTNAYANGLESNQGIVAILASIPPFTDIPYFHSSYAGNELRGIGTLLREEGYQTSFFLGAAQDHFGFGKLCRIVGIDDYLSSKDYPDKSHHDNEWGISDHYFLPFAARSINKQKTPFFSVVYNLSSHPPYKIPADLIKQFNIGKQNAAQNGISYADYSLSLFFREIQSQSWYNNTVFVFTSDHSAAGLMDQEPNVHNAFTIPLFIYIPGTNSVLIEKPVQQLDIVPTILDIIDYGKPFMSFGNSILKNSNSFVYSRINNAYQILDMEYIAGLQESAESLAYIYNHRNDSLLKNHLPVSSARAKDLEAHLKGFLQRYVTVLNENDLLVK